MISQDVERPGVAEGDDVWVRSSRTGSLKVFHQRESCPRLAKATSVRQVPRNSLFDDVRGCELCTEGDD